MKDAIHVSKENYLKAILEAEAEGHAGDSGDAGALAGGFGAGGDDGAEAAEAGWVCGGGRGRGIVRLTETGRETAYRTALRHHLIERMLSEVFGMEWYEIHDEAERLEHAVSPAFEAKLKEKLGEGGACPHGNAVLPVRARRSERNAARCRFQRRAQGERYRVTSLQERDSQLLLFLHRMGIGPNQSLRVLSQNYDQTVSIELDTGNSILGRPAAEAVWLKLDAS